MSRGNNNDQIITGIDIGSSAIRIAAAKWRQASDGRKVLHILGVAEIASEGVQKGVVNSIEDTVSSVSGALEQTERLLGIPIENAWVGIGGTHIISQSSKGVVAVAKSDGEIGDEDVERAVEAARNLAPPLNYEMLHILPKGFVVDGQIGIKDPVGMTGVRLEVDTKIIHGLSAHIGNVVKAIYRTGITIDDLVLASLSTGEVVTTQRQRELGVAVVNIGSTITTMVVYEGGELIHVSALPIGSGHVTNDLAIGMRSSIDVAERVKISFGSCLASEKKRANKIDLLKLGAEESEKVSEKFVAEIIEARMTELLEKIDEELSQIERSGLLPAGVVFTGGGAKIRSLVNLAKEVLGLPASLGFPIDITSSTDKVNDLSFTTAIGLVNWGAGLQSGGIRRRKRIGKLASQTIKGVRNLFKSLIP